MRLSAISIQLSAAALLLACTKTKTLEPDGGPAASTDVQTAPDVDEPEVESPETDTPPAGDTFVQLTMFVDDSQNQSYDESDGLAWKGSFRYDDDLNELEFDGAWAGPFVPLWDDGPRSEGGHEAEGQVAGDRIWTVVVDLPTPESDLVFEYGVITGSDGGGDGQWIWTIHSNGTLDVPAGATGTIEAEGLTIAKWGWADLRLRLDTAKLDAAFDVEIQLLDVKGSSWGWNLVTLDDPDGDGVYEFVLSDHIGQGALEHAGLLTPGDEPEFVFEINSIEYKVAGVPPAGEGGVSAAVWIDDEWVDQEIVYNDKNNTIIVVPEVPKPTDPVDPGFEPPADGVAVSFVVDDSANQTYEAGDGLAWKGSFSVDAQTRVLTYDEEWSGPFAMLWDDGPWDEGGHEPAGATAGDGIWGTTLWMAKAGLPAELEYGAIRGAQNGSDGDWIWPGDNGKVTVTAADMAVDAPGLTIAAFGQVDMRLELTTAATTVEVKGSAWSWLPIALLDDGTQGDSAAGDGMFTFLLSAQQGKHDGKLSPGDQPEWVFVLDGLEHPGLTDGVTAFSDASDPGQAACAVPVQAACTEAAIILVEGGFGDENTAILIE